MRRDIATEREESRDEMALRATLYAHAAEVVDTDSAWESVAPRLATSDVVVDRQRRIAAPIGWAGRSRRALVAAIMAAVLLTSLGALAGFAYSRGCFWGGSSFLCSNFPEPAVTDYFEKVNQSQEQHGVTVTITSAYADRGATVVGYRATLTPELAAQWQGAFVAVMTVTTNSGEQIGSVGEKSGDAGLSLCDGKACLIYFGPAHPVDTARSISLTIEISQMMLHNGPTDSLLAGPWRFHFTLPFHQVIRDVNSAR
jgi:hypothetical protein